MGVRLHWNDSDKIKLSFRKGPLFCVLWAEVWIFRVRALADLMILLARPHKLTVRKRSHRMLFLYLEGMSSG